MAETAPNPDDLPQFSVTMDKNGNPRVYTQESPDAPKERLSEDALLEATGHELVDREYYDMGYEDRKADESKEGKRIDITVPEEEPPLGAPELITEGYPKKATWHAHDGDHEVTVTGSWGIGEDGKTYYKIAESDTGVPHDQLEFMDDSTGEASEPVKAEAGKNDEEKSEKESSKEALRREAINPERIAELKDEFEREYVKELELHNIKTEEDKQKDPWLVQSSADHVRNKLVREYLKIAETDWDPAELTEVREDVMNLMKLSSKTLENLMIRSEEEAKAGEPIAGKVVEGPKNALEEHFSMLDGEDNEEGEGRPSRWQRLKNRVRGVYVGTVSWFAGAPMFEADDSLTEEEKQKKRRHRRLGVIAGMLAAFGAGVVAAKLTGHHHHPGGSGTTTTTGNELHKPGGGVEHHLGHQEPDGDEMNAGNSPAHTGEGGLHESTGGSFTTPDGLSEHRESLTHYGDTIWYHEHDDLLKQLGHEPTNQQIWDATQKTLDANNLSWEQARHLPVGYSFEVPATP